MAAGAAPSVRIAKPHQSIRKQISLYERTESADYQQLVQDVANLTRKPNGYSKYYPIQMTCVAFINSRPLSDSTTIKMRSRHSWVSDNTAATTANYVSVDNLQMLQSARVIYSGGDRRRPATASGGSPKAMHSALVAGTLTQSCTNLKTVAATVSPNDSTVVVASPPPPLSSSPGALRVRTHFINPPLRVAKSFHGQTSFGGNQRQASGVRQTPIVGKREAAPKDDDDVPSS